MNLLLRKVASAFIITGCIGTVNASGYKITNLGALPFTANTTATDINASGQIVGISDNGTNELGNPSQEGFFYNTGVLSPIGPILGRGFNTANAINNSGQIVGTTYGTNDHPTYNAYIYDNGVVTDLGAGSANDINDAGQVVGNSPVPFATNGAFLYENGVRTNLGSLPGDTGSFAAAINENGQITGTSFGTGAKATAFIYENGVMTDLGSLVGNLRTFGNSINDLGQVVGYGLVNSFDTRAFLSVDGVMTDLGIFAGGTRSSANDINNLGQIVGFSDGNINTAMLFENGVMYNLADLITSGDDFSQLLTATAINDSGQIVGSGYFNGSSVESAFLLTHVPLPASFWLFLTGLVALAGRVKKRL